VPWSIPHEPTRTARAAAVSQQGQCEVVRDALGSAPVLAVLGASGELSRVTMAVPTIDTEAEPREVLLGQVIPSTLVHTATGTPTSVEVRNGADVILRASAGISGALVNYPNGAIKALCSPSVKASGRIAVRADSGLPADPPPPYSLPSAGQALLIAASGAHLAVNPGQLSNNDFTYSTFGSFGSGDFNPHWSARGAYMIAGTGGHNHPETFGCLYFDFETGEWGYIAADGQADRGPVNQDTETNGTPFFEMTGTEIPAPPHPYSMQLVLPPSLAGGSRGALAYITRGAVGIGARGAPVAHKFSLPGGVWERLSDGSTDIEGQASYDEVSGRFYVIPNQVWSYNQLRYLRVSDWTWQLSDLTGFTYATGNAGAGSNVFRYGRLLIVHQGTSGESSVGRFQAIDLDNITAGWSILNVTGDVTDVIYENAWAYHAAQDVFYRRYADLSGATDYPQGQVIYKLTPPTSSPLSNTWTIASVTLTGDTIPENRNANVGTQAHKRLMYLPSIEMLAWVTANGVALLNPT